MELSYYNTDILHYAQNHHELNPRHRYSLENNATLSVHKCLLLKNTLSHLLVN